MIAEREMAGARQTVSAGLVTELSRGWRWRGKRDGVPCVRDGVCAGDWRRGQDAVGEREVGWERWWYRVCSRQRSPVDMDVGRGGGGECGRFCQPGRPPRLVCCTLYSAGARVGRRLRGSATNDGLLCPSCSVLPLSVPKIWRLPREPLIVIARNSAASAFRVSSTEEYVVTDSVDT